MNAALSLRLAPFVAEFMLPALMTRLIKEGVELGVADDVVTGRVDSKKGGGTVGVLTGGVVGRGVYYEQVREG